MKMLRKNAVQNPDTLKPVTNDETIRIINALMTSRKNPNEIRVSGMVNKITMGLMIALATPSSRADEINEEVFVNFTPLNTVVATQSENAVTTQCARNSNRSFIFRETFSQ